MTDRPTTEVVPYEPVAEKLPAKSNPAIPDSIWERFQHLGVHATAHLERIVLDPRFKDFSIKDQMRVIETIFSRAYGSPDGAVRKHLHVHTDPESEVGFNALRDLSRTAGRRLPEFRSPSVGGAEDAEVVQAQRRPLNER